MYCEQCGTKILNNAKFCRKCGSEIATQKAEKEILRIPKQSDGSDFYRVNIWKTLIIIIGIWLIQGILVHILRSEKIIKTGEEFGVISLVWLPAIFITVIWANLKKDKEVWRKFVEPIGFVFLSWFIASLLAFLSPLAVFIYAGIMFYLLIRYYLPANEKKTVFTTGADQTNLPSKPPSQSIFTKQLSLVSGTSWWQQVLGGLLISVICIILIIVIVAVGLYIFL